MIKWYDDFFFGYVGYIGEYYRFNIEDFGETYLYDVKTKKKYFNEKDDFNNISNLKHIAENIIRKEKIKLIMDL